MVILVISEVIPVILVVIPVIPVIPGNRDTAEYKYRLLSIFNIRCLVLLLKSGSGLLTSRFTPKKKLLKVQKSFYNL